MSISQRKLSLFLVTLPLALVAACVESRHPLSDENTSRIDERLIGTWQDDAKTMVCRVKKSVDTKNGLDAELADQNGKSQGVLFVTTIRGKQYMSRTDVAGQEDRKRTCEIYQYRFLDNDMVEVRGMEHDVLRKAIADKTLAGTIDEEKRPTITAPPEEIARYLEVHADQCYPLKTDLLLTYKRQE